MKSNLYKIDGNFVNAESSTDAIKTLKKFKKINHAADVEKICNSLEIVPTTENGEMKLFEIMGNEYENSEFNSISISSLSSGMYLIKIFTEKSSVVKRIIKE